MLGKISEIEIMTKPELVTTTSSYNFIWTTQENNEISSFETRTSETAETMVPTVKETTSGIDDATILTSFPTTSSLSQPMLSSSTATVITSTETTKSSTSADLTTAQTTAKAEPGPATTQLLTTVSKTESTTTGKILCNDQYNIVRKSLITKARVFSLATILRSSLTI